MNDSSLLLYTIVLLSNSMESETKRFYRCLNSTTHKKYPTVENNLFNQCGVWRNYSCCSEETSLKIHSLVDTETSLYKFNYQQCEGRNLSHQCTQYFIDDLCFYQCSPYNLAWIIEAPMKIRTERYYKVPLCRSDCEAWYDACQYDYTCSDNWSRNFLWQSTGNQCLKDIQCSTFADIFGSAINFCEKIWDDSWRVVDDRRPCMKLRTTTSLHNKLVGIHYAKKLSLFSSAHILTFSYLLLCLTILTSIPINYNGFG